MKRFEMTREYWINKTHQTVCESVKFDYKPTLFELRSDAKLGFCYSTAKVMKSLLFP